MAENTRKKTATTSAGQILPKIKYTRLVQYVDSHMARSHCLTCLQTEVNNLLK